jgi:hypothetical protein
MAMIVAGCPRCRAKVITFDVKAGRFCFEEHGWKSHYEIYSECRSCFKGTILCISVKDIDASESFNTVDKIMSFKAALNAAFEITGFISLKDQNDIVPPNYLPENVNAAFKEAASCFAAGCFNASGAMFRLAIDLATKSLLPEGDATSGGPNRQQRKQLHERLHYLFETGKVSPDLRGLATCVKEDGNDGAHDGTLKRADAEDLCDFATELFRRMFTEPERLRLAQMRREKRDR